MKELKKVEFQITEEECQAMIDKTGFVCGGCGEKETPIQTTDNFDDPTYWHGCMNCSEFRTGVPVSIWKTANLLYDQGSRSRYGESKKDHLLSISRDAWRVVIAYQKVKNETNI